MTAAPACAITDLCSPRTFPDAARFAPEPMAATTVASLLAPETPASADRPIPGPSLAFAPSAKARPRPSRAAPPSAKSP